MLLKNSEDMAGQDGSFEPGGIESTRREEGFAPNLRNGIIDAVDRFSPETCMSLTPSKCNFNLTDAVRDTIAENRMIRRGQGVVIGVSGGPDSIALLHVVNALKTEMGFWIAVAHVDHSLRPESAQDALFVRECAEKLDLKVHVKRVDVRFAAAQCGVSIEEVGRSVRYAFFEEIRKTLAAHRIATAHHVDDVLETFFLRVLRGSSLKGLGGIPAKRRRIIRPFIGQTKAEILRFLDERGIPFRQDPTNVEMGTDRNVIRNKLFPVIAERFPDFRKPLRRSIDMIRREERLLRQLSKELHCKVVSVEPERMIVDLVGLRDVPYLLASRMILRTLYELSGEEVRWQKAHLDAIMRTARGDNPSAVLDLPGGFAAQREYDRMILARKPDAKPSLPVHITVEGPGTIVIPEAELSITFRILEKAPTASDFPDGGQAALFDADQAKFPLVLRSPKAGDRFRPWGMDGSRKLKRVFIDLKIPVRLRRVIPILVNGEEILWLPGIRRGRAAAVGSRTRCVLEVSLVSEKRDQDTNS
jgi:tRNA(Ile)-lysidine synthase